MQLKSLSIFALVLAAACAATVGGATFGNNSSEFANDGECDDPRFTGRGMADWLSDEDIQKDAADCKALLEAGSIRFARTQAEWDPAQCSAIDYGNNSSEWARDGECDDPRFTGPGIDDIMIAADRRADATDCRALCNAGEVWLK